MESVYSIKEFQAALATRGIVVTGEMIRLYLVQGKLKGKRLFAGRWYIYSSELERLLDPASDFDSSPGE